MISWLAAASAAALAPLLIALGQGLGALLGGCEWIGVFTSIDRQPWALVNQPSVAYASQPIALLYWLGGPLVALVWSLAVLPLFPRPNSLVWELAALQSSWMSIVAGLAWYPLLDLWDGHASRMLLLWDQPAALVWVFPVVGAWCAMVPAAHVLRIVRSHERHLSRGGRLAAVVLHLVLPATAWVALANWLRVTQPAPSTSRIADLESWAANPWVPVAGVAMPVIAALLLAWFLFPRPFSRRPPTSKTAAGFVLALAATTLFTAQWLAGKPSPDGFRRGFVWSAPDSRNNIRPWIEPVRIAARSPVGASHTEPAGQRP